jgi:ssDNA-binding replication factor A large subunit
LTKESIQKLIEEKKRSGRGLLSDEGAARLVAEELLVETETKQMRSLRMRDLIPGLSDVTITGRVVAVWPLQGFQRRDGTRGNYMHILLADGTGTVRCTIWNERMQQIFVENNLQGKLIKLLHCYTREGLLGRVEIHAGDRGEVQVEPPDIHQSDFPLFEQLFSKISAISMEMAEANVVGVVQTSPRLFTFEREGSLGKVLKTVIADRTGQVAIAAWNTVANELEGLKKGDIVQIVGGKIKLDQAGSPEIHLESRSRVSVLTEEPAYFEGPLRCFVKIAELEPRLRNLNLQVLALTEPREMELTSQFGKIMRVTQLIVGDETGLLVASFWNETADIASKARKGDVFLIEGASTRERRGQLLLDITKSASISFLGVKESSSLTLSPKVTKLSDLSSVKGLVIIEGEVMRNPLRKDVITRSGERVPLTVIVIRDGTGEAVVSLWRKLAEKAETLCQGSQVRIVGLRVRKEMSGKFELSSIHLTDIELKKSGQL